MDTVTIRQVITPQTPAPEARQHLVGAIQSLDSTTAMIMSLHFLDGLSVNEIAMVLELPPVMIQDRVDRGRRKLLPQLAAARNRTPQPAGLPLA